MKTLILMLAVAYAFFCKPAIGQKNDFSDYFQNLPGEMQLNNHLVRTYRMVTDYLDYDLKGNFLQKTRISGMYTCGLDNNQVRWNNVKIAQCNDEEGLLPEGETRQYMENFAYVPGADAVSETFFANIPQADFHARNLIWDRLMFDCFAYWDWDSLKLNREYTAENLNGTIDLAGQGYFNNSDIRLTWKGITEKNGEICAIIHYVAMNNPLSIEVKGFVMKGRSHYWGDVYVSLEDKEIEHGTMSEDVITDIKMDGQPDNHLGYTVRYITLEKIK